VCGHFEEENLRSAECGCVHGALVQIQHRKVDIPNALCHVLHVSVSETAEGTFEPHSSPTCCSLRAFSGFRTLRVVTETSFLAHLI
jgi:hypothetical protein